MQGHMDTCGASSPLSQWDGSAGTCVIPNCPTTQGSQGLGLLLLRVMHPGQEDGEWTREERRGVRQEASSIKDKSNIRVSVITNIPHKIRVKTAKERKCLTCDSFISI